MRRQPRGSRNGPPERRPQAPPCCVLGGGHGYSHVLPASLPVGAWTSPFRAQRPRMPLAARSHAPAPPNGIIVGPMGKVVDIDTAATEQKAARRARSRRKPSKTALVLGGGGFTGGVYEIGALRAFDLLATNRTVNQFDIYVGTSAGAFVSSMIANGVTPEEMMRVLNRDLPSPLRDIDLGTLLQPNFSGFFKSGLMFPFKLASVLREMVEHLGEVSAVDLATGLAGALPKGIYSGRGIERYVAQMLGDPDRTNDFRLLEAELYLTATDLDSTERVVLGEGEWADVPISAGRRRLGCVARDLRAGRDQGARVHRRGNPLDHQRRRRDRARGEVRRRDQPARPLHQRLREVHPDDHRLARAPGLRHGDRRDHQPDLPPALPRPAAPRGRDLGGALPGGRHHLDRARVRRRVDVRHLDPRLQRPPADRQARVRVRDHEARPRLRPLQVRRRAPRDRDLGPPGSPRARPGRARPREALRLAPGARAHQRRAAARLALGGAGGPGGCGAGRRLGSKRASGRSAPASAG